MSRHCHHDPPVPDNAFTRAVTIGAGACVAVGWICVLAILGILSFGALIGLVDGIG